MKVIDYNGAGRWTLDAIRDRYAAYTLRFHVREPRDLRPREHENGATRWVYPVMEQVIDAIEAGDPACIELGVELIEEDQKMPFGKILKSKTARVLRRADLTAEQVARIRTRVIGMLIAGHVPHEFRDYAKLLRRIGVGADSTGWANIRDRLDTSNPYVMRFYEYLKTATETRRLS
jgi:hypothetical protein